MHTDDPFAALAALRGTLPDGPAEPAPSQNPRPKPALRATVHFERKGRGGKEATIVVLPDQTDPQTVAGLGAALKKRLATGGSVRGTEILLQGDRRKDLETALPALGVKTV